MSNGIQVKQIRHRVGWLLLFLGLLLSAISLAAEPLGLDLTPGFGMIQMFQLLLGMTCLTLTAFIYLYGLRPENAPRSLQADISLRVVLTGVFFMYVCGLSDLVGIGTHIQANDFERPFIGPLQFGGISLSLLLVILGLALYHTSRGQRSISSMQFLVPEEETTS